MRRPRWYSLNEKKPPRDGRYWVFPYRTLGGHLAVTMATLKDGEWVAPSRPQEYAYWKPIDIPEPPKVNYKRLLEHKEDSYDGVLGDGRRKSF